MYRKIATRVARKDCESAKRASQMQDPDKKGGLFAASNALAIASIYRNLRLKSAAMRRRFVSSPN